MNDVTACRNGFSAASAVKVAPGVETGSVARKGSKTDGVDW